MSPALEPQPETMDNPFNEPSADILICSSDNVTFRLHKIILSLASEFFRDMFSLPQPAAQSTASDSELSELGGLPIIHVTEPSDVLERLFRLCYPIDDPVLETVDEVRSTLDAALKYQMGEAFKIIKARLLALAKTSSLQAYAVACQFGLEQEASIAAEEVLVRRTQNTYVEELEGLSIGAYIRLLSFCEAQDGARNRRRFTFHRPGREPHSSTPSASAMPSMDQTALETSDALPETKHAPYPFNLEDAKVVLITSDGVEFRVFRQILQLSSPVLSSRLAALPSNSMHIAVTEHSRVLSILLEICYPTPSPAFIDLHDIIAALTAAVKYQMEKASQVLRSALSSLNESPAEDPVQLYALACHFGIRDLALAAARRTLHTDVLQSSVSELDFIGVSAGSMYRLLAYHARCRSAVQSLFGLPSYIDMPCEYCRRGHVGGCWWGPYVMYIQKEDWPSSEYVTSDELLHLVMTSQGEEICSFCQMPHGIQVFLQLSRSLAAAIDAKEKGVALHWYLPRCS